MLRGTYRFKIKNAPSEYYPWERVMLGSTESVWNLLHPRVLIRIDAKLVNGFVVGLRHIFGQETESEEDEVGQTGHIVFYER